MIYYGNAAKKRLYNNDYNLSVYSGIIWHIRRPVISLMDVKIL